ncbi:peptidoglycan-binding protein [Nocardia tengchongensis]
MAGTAESMLAECKKHVGYTEYENNGSTFGEWYGMNHQPWCDMFVSYCADKSGNADVIGRFAYTVYHAQWFQQRGQWRPGTTAACNTAQPGDIVFFDFDGTDDIGAIDHVGVVVKSLGNGRIRTIEGNANKGTPMDRCDYFERTAGVIAGFGRPRYEREPIVFVDGVPQYPGHLITEGSVGEAVELIQKQLNTVAATGLDIDGEFGSLTTSAVVAFQAGHELEADGQVGPLTWSKLFAPN